MWTFCKNHKNYSSKLPKLPTLSFTELTNLISKQNLWPSFTLATNALKLLTHCPSQTMLLLPFYCSYSLFLSHTPLEQKLMPLKVHLKWPVFQQSEWNLVCVCVSWEERWMQTVEGFDHKETRPNSNPEITFILPHISWNLDQIQTCSGLDPIHMQLYLTFVSGLNFSSNRLENGPRPQIWRERSWAPQEQLW